MKNLLSIKLILDQELDPAFAKRAHFIFDEVKKNKPFRVLDIGCGRGFYVKCLTFFPHIKEIIGIDLNEKYLTQTRKLTKSDHRVKIEQGSVYDLQYKNNYFDCIIASEILEHLTDDKKALIELKRVLKPRGHILISVPHLNFPFFWDPLNYILMKMFRTHINKNIWWLAGIWADHERLYSEKNIKSLIEKSGFKIKRFERITKYCWPGSHFFLYAIGKNLIEILGAKNVSRFNFNKSPLTQLLAGIIRFPSKLEKKIKKTDRYMDMFISCQNGLKPQ